MKIDKGSLFLVLVAILLIVLAMVSDASESAFTFTVKDEKAFDFGGMKTFALKDTDGNSVTILGGEATPFMQFLTDQDNKRIRITVEVLPDRKLESIRRP